MVFILVTQRPLTSIMRGEGKLGSAIKQGGLDLIDGLAEKINNKKKLSS